jgi:hypothetical protein
MYHITGPNDKIEFERKVLRKLTLVLRNHNVMGTELLDVIRLVRGGSKGVDLGTEGTGEEDYVVAL